MNANPRNAFGIEPREPPEPDLERAIHAWSGVISQLDELFELAQRDAAIAAASGRWQPGRPDPDHYVPGDVVALRAFAVSADLVRLHQYHEVIVAPRTLSRAEDAEVRLTAMRRTLLSLADNRALFDAVPHFLDSNAAVGILASRPPERAALESLKLPHPRVAVYFDRPLELGAELQDWPERWDVLTDLRGEPVGRTAIGDLRAMGGAIEGVVLTEAAGGGLVDEVLWLISANPDPTRRWPYALDRYRATVWGRLSSARLSHVAYNLAATVSWAEWREPSRPLELPQRPDSREWRKTVRRGQFRRREPRGEAAGVRVLDVARTPLADRVERSRATDSTRSSPSTHLRRAHWRSQPVGVGLSQRRLVRVPATVVNPGQTQMGPVVYRIPAPDPEPKSGGFDLRSVDLPPPAGPEEPTSPARSAARYQRRAEPAQPEVVP